METPDLTLFVEYYPQSSPPSPEGELMETHYCWQLIIFQIKCSPPSPEGELMETLIRIYVISLIFFYHLTAFA